jgi:hypothetical protein
MQAVIFSYVNDDVKFWWIKPTRADRKRLEKETLRLHDKGPFKNTAGRSKPLYAPLAAKFCTAPQAFVPPAQEEFTFGVDDSGRAYIDDTSQHGCRMLVYLIWQESWSNVLASSKYVRGKIFYEKGDVNGGRVLPEEGMYFARQYEIRDGHWHIAMPDFEERVPSLLPPDSFQEMRELFIVKV